MPHFRKSFPMLLTITLLTGCRQDMHDQPRFKPLAESDFFTDLRSARLPVEGTVARGQLREDAYFYTGKLGSTPGDFMPFPINLDVLARGRLLAAPIQKPTSRQDLQICQRKISGQWLIQT